MATNPNEVGEQGWVIDPQNPNRATYTDPDGNVLEAFKPETPAAPAEPTTRGAWQRLKDSTVEASQYGFPGAVARKWYDWTDTGVQELKKKGYSDEDAERIADTMIGEAQKGLRAEMAAKQEADPNWNPDESFWENAGAIDRWGPWLAGQLAGSAGPESAIPMGKFAQYGAKTAAALRMGAAAGVNAATGALYQGLDMIDQARDEFSVEEMLSDAAIGAGFQGAFEVPGFIKNLFKERGVDTTPAGAPDGKRAPLDNTRLTPEDEAGWTEILQTGTFDDIIAYRDRIKDEYGFNVASSEIAAWVNGRNKAAEAGQELDAYAVYQGAQTGGEVGPQQTASVAPEFKPTERLTQERANLAVDHINTITKDWKNAPEITVYNNFDELEGVDNDAIGVFRDGKVDINLRQVMDEAEAAGLTADDMLSSVAFHEALGHYGLAQKFGDGLDLTLNKLYDSGGDFTQKVDQWMADNPGAYADDMDPLARAAEEVLAEMSEKGQIKPNVMALLRNQFKQFARDMGLDLKFSDGEIRTILGMSHNAVVNGKGRDVISNGFRYMFAGENARQADTSSLEQARKDVSMGFNPETVRANTGWFKAPDGKWRFEIDDTEAYTPKFEEQEGAFETLADLRDDSGYGKSAKDVEYDLRGSTAFDKLADSKFKKDYGIKELPLYSVLQHTKLFQQYPELQDVRVTREPHMLDWGRAVQGSFDARANLINITPYSKEPMSTLLHEIQHKVQEIEGFARGGNSKSVIAAMPDDIAISAVDNYVSWLKAQDKQAKLELTAFRNFENNPDSIALYKLNEETQKAQDKYDYLNTSHRRKFKKKNPDLGDGPDFYDAWAREAREIPELEKAKAEYYDLIDKRKKSESAFIQKHLGLTWSEVLNSKKLFLEWFEINRVLHSAATDTRRAGRIDQKQRLYDVGWKRLLEAERIVKNKDAAKAKELIANNEEGTYQAYQHLFGEVEARDVQARRNMSEAERQATAPYTSEPDLDPDSFIYDFQGSDKSAESRYMRPTRGKRAAPDTEEKAPTRRIGGVNLNNIEGVQDIDYLLEEAQARSGGPTSSVPRGQTVLSGKALGLTPTKVMKEKYNEAGLAARIDAGSQLLVNQLGRIQNLLDKSATQGDLGSAKTHVRIAKEMATLSAIFGRVSGNNSEVGRALNILNRVRDVTKSADEILKYMQASGSKVYSDPNMLTQLSKMMKDRLDAGDTAGAAKLARASFKPKAEDFIFRLWFNMMLSSPATHAANFLGTGGNFIMDLMENTGAAVLGQGKRFSNADRIRGREVAYRVWGALRALTTADTWAKSRESLNTGLTGNMPNLKAGETSSNVYTGNDPALGFMSGLLESPTRALAGADEWWRNVLQMSNMYGLAVRNAGNKGLKGSEFWDEVDSLIANPTKEMIEATNDYTKVIQFLDKPSGIAETIINAQTPKPNSRVPGRIARGTLKFFVPFVRTPDALIRSAIRRSGPLGALERENIEGWKKGGAERDKVIARMYMGSALAFWVATQAYKGEITGAGPSDYDKKMEWLGTNQENSIKVGDEWVSIAGLEPVSTNLTAIATLVERYKQGELSDEDYGKSAIAATQGLAAVLGENSYLQGIQDLVTISSTDPGKAQSGLTNFLAGLASSATTPAILRKQVQSEDPAVRDTTGDGSFTDRVKGRIMSGAPGLSDELPQRYDVYGRPMVRDIAGPDMLTRANTKDVETDPAVLELERLASATDKTVIGPPSKSNIKVDGVARRLTAQEFQAYQQLSGYWIVETVRQEMASPEWEAMSDEEKLDILDDIKKDMRANAREYLFNSSEEESENE